MRKNKRKSSLTFVLDFTTSKLLAYIVIILSSTIGYLINSSDVVVVGLIVGSTLSGAKSITDNIMKIKSSGIIGGGQTASNETTGDETTNEPIEDDSEKQT